MTLGLLDAPCSDAIPWWSYALIVVFKVRRISESASEKSVGRRGLELGSNDVRLVALGAGWSWWYCETSEISVGKTLR